MSNGHCAVRSFLPALLAGALCAALAACDGAAPAGHPDDIAPASTTAATESPLPASAAIAAAAGAACSYDGAPVQVGSDVLGSRAPQDCAQMVDHIMRFTGLPPNFVVGEAQVPNAVATILLDDRKVPQRVIAFNPRFIEAVGRATNSTTWAPMSIMAHEIGHHLSGHTITGTGSQPPIELEADKFSGFILYRMGAPLLEASRAIETLVGPDDSATHPGRDRRMAAIREGWMDACRQQGRADCETLATATTLPATGGPTAPAPADTPTVAQAGLPERLPSADPSNLPAKQGRFVVDESGLLGADERARLERQLFQHARDHGVEIVLLLVRDLQGLGAEDFAWAMLRQMRVGKLDVGNGAVLVVAPEHDDAAVAMGPGVALAMEGFEGASRLRSWIEQAWPTCQQPGGCRGWTQNLFMLPELMMRQTAGLDWAIRHRGLAELRAAAERHSRQRLDEGGEYRAADDTVYRRLVRFEGTVQALDTPVGVVGVKEEILANGPIVAQGKRAVHVKSDDGYDAIVYLEPRTVPLMPAGLPAVGERYTFVGRVQRPAALRGHADHLFLLSWERL